MSPSLWGWEDAELIPHATSPGSHAKGSSKPLSHPGDAASPRHCGQWLSALPHSRAGVLADLWCFTSSPEPGPCSAASAEERSRFSGEPQHESEEAGRGFFLAGGTVSSSQLGRGNRTMLLLFWAQSSHLRAHSEPQGTRCQAPAWRQEMEQQVSARGAPCLWTSPGLTHPIAGTFPGC